MTRKPPAASRVPQSRLGRLARLGLAAGELAVGGAMQGLRRLGGSSEAEPMFSVATARRLAERLANLRGAAMKLGQLISLESEGLLPPELAQALESLRSQAAPMPLAQLRRVLGRAYGSGWERRFARFDETPIASASIGQVHRARTIDGRELALKVQYPGVARSITSDVDNVATLLRLAQLLPLGVDVEEIAREAKRQLAQEADYLAEAGFLEQYARLVADDPLIVLPKVHWDFTTARVMAMDYMEGVPLDSLGAETPQAIRDTLGAALQRLMFRELFEFRVMQTDPNFANYLYQPSTARLVLLDFGATQHFSRAYAERYRRITRAIVAGDRPAIEREARRIGYIAEDACAGCGRRSDGSTRTRLRAAALRRRVRLWCVRPAAPRARTGRRSRLQARPAADAAVAHAVPASQAGRRVPAAGAPGCARADRPAAAAVSRPARDGRLRLTRRP